MKGYLALKEDKHEYSMGVGYYSPNNNKKYSFYLSLDDCPEGAAVIYKIDVLGKILSDKKDDKIYYTDMIKILQALPQQSKITKERNGG